MYASVITAQVDPDKMEEAGRFWQENMMSEARQEVGYVAGYLVSQQQTGKALMFTLWVSEADAFAYETSGKYQQDVARLCEFLLTPPVREVYRVSAQV